MNTHYFYYQDGHTLTQDEIDAQNAKRQMHGFLNGRGWIEVCPDEVKYHYSEHDDGDYLVGSVVGAARDGNDFDTFVLTAERGTELVAYLYGIDALDYTEDDLCEYFHSAVTMRKIQKGEHR